MPSPFPGMNPYLERAYVWESFHHHFCAGCLEWLAPQLGDRYFVLMEQRVYIHEMPDDVRRLVGRGDVSVHHPANGTGRRGTPAATVLTKPRRARIPVQDVERQLYLQVRDRERQQMVTVIEILSPTNKRRGSDRDQYLAKREEIVRSPAHFVEIDLLRGGVRPPLDTLAPCDYYALVSRADERPDVDVWPVRLREPLPAIPVDLLPGDPPATLDLQAVLHAVYDRGHYATSIYAGTPEPLLSRAAAKWAMKFVPPRP